MPDVKQLLAVVKRVFPKPNRTIEEVGAATTHIESTGDLEMPALESLRAPAGEGELYGMPRTEVLDKTLRDGLSGLEKARKGDSDLTPAEQFGLEAIVHLFGRPALLVQDDDFAAPPPEWQSLEARRTMLRAMLPSVGRVELDGHHTYPWCGTAFLVGDGILMTNRHVAEIFSRKAGKVWAFLRGVRARVDYKEEYQRDKSREFKVNKVLTIHPTYDLALLSVSKKGPKGAKSPAPLTLSSKQPKATKDVDVAVIGYPAFDSRNGTQAQIDIFKNIYNVKRLQPGKTTGLKETPQILGHDCSTLGGNSGSCVVDLETGNVVGLHFGGQYLKGNVSVPLWKLKDDKTLKKFGLNWV